MKKMSGQWQFYLALILGLIGGGTAFYCAFWMNTAWTVWEKESLPPPAIKPTIEQPIVRARPALEEPTFKARPDIVMINIGGNSIKLKWTDLITSSYEPFDFAGFKPIRVYVQKDKLFVDAVIYPGDNSKPIEIKRNEYGGIPPGWDINSNAKALEIVNKACAPLFQLIYKSPTEVIINGIFVRPNSFLFINENGWRTPPLPSGFVLKQIFKYPSWQYPGEYQ